MIEVELGGGFDGVEETAAELCSDRVPTRLFAQDAGLWGPAAEPEASIRLGWTDFSARAAQLITEIDDLRSELRERGVDRVVLSGMGGSSLAPEVICAWAGVDLVVLDSTHPEQVRRATERDLARTVVVVSSKSGSTVETQSHRRLFEKLFRDEGIDPASRIVVVTDPGSPLEASAREAGQRVFLADPNVGGRYSALTAFGLVPAGLAGADLRLLVSDAEGVRPLLADDDLENPAVRLASAVASGLPGRFALGLSEAQDARWGLADWIEQLIAESTGKDGLGVLPVPLHADAPELSGAWPASMLPVTLAAENAEPPATESAAVIGPLGSQLLLWETATAILGRLMGIDPFDQPDVESAKAAARAILSAETTRPVALGAFKGGDADIEVLAAKGDAPRSVEELVARLGQSVPAGGYVSVQAYLDREGDTGPRLRRLRDRLARSLGVPVTLGWGPRFLHSTGQLHKGGPGVGVFLQLLDDPDTLIEIEGIDGGFAALISAQAAGDRQVLADHGLPVFALRCSDPAEAVDALVASVPDDPGGEQPAA